MVAQRCKRSFRKASAIAISMILIFAFGNIVKAHLFGIPSYSGGSHSIAESITLISNFSLMFLTASERSTSRRLLTGPWETCGFEKENGHYVFIIPYVFLIFLCFIGNIYIYIHYALH